MQHLPDAELDVMLSLWETQQPAPRVVLEEKLQHRNWNANTLNTLLTRLEEKGFVNAQRQGRTNFYTPLIQKEEYLSFAGSSMLHKLYGSSLKNLVVSLSQNEPMAQDEISELQQLLETLKREG